MEPTSSSRLSVSMTTVAVLKWLFQASRCLQSVLTQLYLFFLSVLNSATFLEMNSFVEFEILTYLHADLFLDETLEEFQTRLWAFRKTTSSPTLACFQAVVSGAG